VIGCLDKDHLCEGNGKSKLWEKVREFIDANGKRLKKRWSHVEYRGSVGLGRGLMGAKMA